MQISTDRITAVRLAGHHLSDAGRTTPGSIVSWMGAMQAQDYNMAKWAVGVRLPGSTDAQVEAAFNRGEIIRTHVMRPTWHFVAPDDLRGMLSLSADRIKASARSRDRDLGITEALYDRTNRIIRDSLEGNRHLTRRELSAVFLQSGIEADAARMTHFMMRAEVDAIVCSGAMQGKEQTYALMDERIPARHTPPREEALAGLARAYFRSHSPATLRDFVWWAGLSAAEARSGIDAAGTHLFAEVAGGQTYWTADAFRATPNRADAAFLLPAFDEYIIAYSDRSAAIPSENLRETVSSNGIFRPTVIVAGQVAGLWKKQAKMKKAQITYFRPVEDAVRSLVESAARDYESFLSA
jgi:hypothetical protein